MYLPEIFAQLNLVSQIPVQLRSSLSTLKICFYMQLGAFQRVQFCYLGRVKSGHVFLMQITILWMRWSLSLNPSSKFRSCCMTNLFMNQFNSLFPVTICLTSPFFRSQFPEGRTSCGPRRGSRSCRGH